MKYKINPFPAVRVNWKWWRFTPRAKAYHEKMNNLRSLVLTWEYSNDQIMEALINWNYRLEFVIKIPKSWNKKDKEKMNWQPHKQSPDIDNLYKAFTDTVFYSNENFNDKEIYKLHATKYWGDTWEIIFTIT